MDEEQELEPEEQKTVEDPQEREMDEIINQLKNNKIPVGNGIVTEILKYETGKIPDRWKNETRRNISLGCSLEGVSDLNNN